MKLKIEKRDITELKPNPKNPRIHKKENTDKIKDSILEFGFTNPIIIDEYNMILAGHGRFQAGKDAQIKEIPVICMRGLTEAQKQIYTVADNRLGSLSEWDNEKLDEMIKEIDTLLDQNGIDPETLQLTGFSEDEIKEMLDVKDEISVEEGEDDAPELPVNPLVESGELWFLGNHRLIIGDSTEAQTYETLMEKEKSDLLITDPPYNVAYEGSDGKTIQNDSMSDSEFRSFLDSVFLQAYKNLRDEASGYVFFASREFVNFHESMKGVGFGQLQQLIWNKSSFTLSFAKYKQKYEPLFFITKGKGKKTWRGGNNKSTVIDSGFTKKSQKKKNLNFIEHLTSISKGRNVSFEDPIKNLNELIEILQTGEADVIDYPKPKKNTIHPTMKPVGLLEKLISNSSYKHDLVLEPFGGSGSTMIACEKLNRKCYSIELDEAYAEASIERWQNFTGQIAKNLDGETLDDKREKRKKS